MRRMVAAMCGVALALPLTALPAVAKDDPPPARSICKVNTRVLPELSGMARSLRHARILWVHNDSSGGAMIYAVDATTCMVKAKVQLLGVQGRDIEAIGTGLNAQGEPVIWVGDIGDNQDSWPYVWLYQLPEPETLEDQSVEVRAWRFTYPDGPHNAETLLVSPKGPRVWVVTKQLAAGTIYRFPTFPDVALGEVWQEPLIVEPVGETDGLISDGSVSADGSTYVLRDYLNAYIFSGRPKGTPVATVELPIQPQGEAIVWAEGGRALLAAGEREGNLWRIGLPESAWSASAKAEAAAAAATQDQGSSSSGITKAAIVVAILLGLAILWAMLSSRRERRRRRRLR